MAKIARRLKGLARELRCPFCAWPSSTGRRNTRSNKPQLSHLRESGAIEQDADVVMFVHREEYYMTNEEDREQVGASRPVDSQAAQRPRGRNEADLEPRVYAA